jgi:Icc-related predicted phosphoesterase
MTRILYMSDLHLEMERFRLTMPGWAAFMARHSALARHPTRGPLLDGLGQVDLVVMAGDIHNGLRGMVYAEQVSAYLDAPVVMVAGNHEYYHHDEAVLLPALRRAAAHTGGRVRFLENESAMFTFGGQTLAVLGCTLWTDYALNGDAQGSMMEAQAMMNDHNFITLNALPFTPLDAQHFHVDSLRWLHRELGRVAATRVIVVTHHAPSAKFLGQRRGAIAPAYASEILQDFAPFRPHLWIHGHTHYRHDSLIGQTRIVSAPRGYVAYDGADALQFRPGVIEI